MLKKALVLILFLLPAKNLVALNDTLYVSNGDVLIGEVKSMERSVLTMETEYSDSDFKIDWDKILEIYSDRTFIISISDGERYYGRIRTDQSDSTKVIIAEELDQYSVNLSDVVLIQQVDRNVLSRLSASLDFGFSFAKTNNLTQYSLRSNLGFLADKWSADASFNGVRSSQDDVESTKRNDASVGVRYFFPHDFFIFASANFLQNDEQKLKLRSTPQAGIGYYIIRTNSVYLNAGAGVAWNNESFTDPTIPTRNSAEGFLGSELNMFDMGDFSVLSSLVVYPSFTERGRVRSDFKIDLKYDLPYDFYIKLGYTLNYDNQPVEGAAESDFVFQTNIGWEW